MSVAIGRLTARRGRGPGAPRPVVKGVAEAGRGAPLRGYAEQVWRRRRLVLVVTVAALLVSLSCAALIPVGYTARATLSAATKSQSPDQDAALAAGYARYFNEQTYAGRVRTALDIPSGVRFKADTEGAGPILAIAVLAADRDAASRYAGELADRFRTDINAAATGSHTQAIDAVNRQIDQRQALLNQPTVAPGERMLITQQIFDLDQRITDLVSDPTNQLNNLQLDAGVSANSRGVPGYLLAGLLGGLLLGVAAALGVAVARGRLDSPRDISKRLGLATLTVLDTDRYGDQRPRADRLRALANVVALNDLPRPAVLAVAPVERTSLAADVAEALVYYRAQQGTRTLLVRADLREGIPEHYANGSTVAGLLDGAWTSALTPVTFSVGATQVPVLPAGRTGADPYPLFAPDRVRALLRHLAGHCDLVVVLTPPVAQAPEAQILCAVADSTIVVVETDVTTASGGERAVGLLEQVNAPVLGAVLATRPNHRYLGVPEPFATLPRLGAPIAAEPA